jgi:predicted MFS family arabinose efflux permease
LTYITAPNLEQLILNTIRFQERILTQTTKPISLQARLATFFGLNLQIMSIVFLARFTMDTGTRSLYPFIPQISAGLGLTVVGFSWLIFFRAMAGLAGPVFGLLADRYGRRTMMATALMCQGIGVAGLALSSGWWATLPIILFGLSLAAFLPAGQAYISDRVAYQKRGRALAAIEFSWAMAGIVSLPVIGWLIDASNWRTPFFWLALLSLAGATLVWLWLPPVEHRSRLGLNWVGVWEVCRRPNVLAAIGVGLLLFVAVSNFITVWSIWLSADFGLEATALGLVATGIGVAELGGAVLSSLFIDRLGKRRGSQLGLSLMALAFLLLPLTQVALPAAVIGLIALGIINEFTIVSLLPLYSEQAPEARATVFSLIAAGISIGVATGSPVTAKLWADAGLWPVCLVAAMCLFAALGLVKRFLQD